MASEVDICNLALARLGDSATVSQLDPPEGSVQAEHCAIFYPIARDTLLEMHPWRFAVTRVDLAILDTEEHGWAYAYAMPSDCLVALGVLSPGSGEDQATEDYEIEGDILYSNIEDAVLRYTRVITDTTRFSHLFVEALSWLLASHLSGPILKGDAGAKSAIACYKQFAIALSMARHNDSNQRKAPATHTVPWIAARG